MPDIIKRSNPHKLLSPDAWELEQMTKHFHEANILESGLHPWIFAGGRGMSDKKVFDDWGPILKLYSPEASH